ncbi:hypothetical protein ACFWBH_01180 [Streptomyces sp. NPDC059999]|uniref:hypothetical protein n=1 Tax=unclassified Streptomyces TaxID=2593676 RepID=UPI00365BC04E
MFKTKKARVIAWTSGAAVIAATALGGVAMAAIGGANAPFAQASAVINADGSVSRSKGVADVWLGPTSGRFCVRLSDTRLNVNELTPVATLDTGGWPGRIYIENRTSSQCNNRADTILVVTTNQNEGGDYKPFSLLVP